MQLDSNTLMFSIGILSLLMAFVSWTFPATITDRDFGLQRWAVGICFVGFSLILIFLRDQVHPFFGVFLANVFLMTGGTLGLVAPARFFQVPYRRGAVVLAWALGVSGLVAYLGLGLSIAYAMMGVCFAMAIVMLHTVQIVLTHARRPIPFPARIFALSMGFMGVAYCVRASLVAMNPQVGVGPVSLAGSHQSMLIVGALFVVSSTISFYSMVHDEQKHQIAERARRDPLTGLYNRRAFFEMAAQIEQEQPPYSILMIDIDHFKSINDTYGHLGGDAVLSHAGRLIMGAFRIDDIPCRFGGEEFCVLLRRCDAREAMTRAHTLVAQFSQHAIRLPGGEEVRISVSVGVCPHLPGRATLKTIQSADLALYDAKHGGRNQARMAADSSAQDRAASAQA